MAIVITKKTRTILFIILGVLVVGGGGFLFWRINQQETVAPTDSDAASCTGYTYNGAEGCQWVSISSSAKCCGASICSSGLCLPNGSCATSDNVHLCASDATECTSATSCSFSVNNEWMNSIPAGCYKNVGGSWMSCKSPTPTPTKYTLKYIAGTGGSITGSATQTVEKGKSGTAVTAVADDGYTFVKWSDDKTSASRTDSNVQGNITVTAQFEAKASEYTLTYTAGTGGSISGTSPQTVAEGGDGTAVTAVPNNGYKFVQWSDKITANPRTDENVTSNISVTAQFTELEANEYTLTYIAGDNGSITGDTTQTVEEGNDGTEVTAVANSGYKFSKWSDGVTTASRKDTNVDANITVTAQFGVVVSGGSTVPQTGVLDTVLGKVSLGVSFIFLGGLVSQYSRINYFFNSLTEKSRFRKEIKKQKRIAKNRRKLEDRFK